MSVLLEELSVPELKAYIRSAMADYLVAKENFEFVTAADMKEEIDLAKQALKDKQSDMHQAV